MEEKEYEFSITPVAELFYNDDSAYGVYVFYTDDIIPHTEQSEQTSYDDDVFGFVDGGIVSFVNRSRLVGKMQRLDIGSSYAVVASPSYSKKYEGWSYNVVSIKNKAPKTKSDQIKYLESIITKIQTRTLLGAYPNIVKDVIDGNVDIDLSKTPGIKEKTWNKIKDKIESSYVMSDILSLLSPLGVSMSKIRKIFDGEKNTAILKQKLLDDPYFLADMQGITFRKADEVALKLNPSLKISRERASAFIKGYFKKIGSESGHTWANIDSLSNEVRDNIFSCYELYEEIIAGQKELNTFLHIDGDKVGMASYFRVEKNIYNIIKDISESKPIKLAEDKFEESVSQTEEEQGFEFTKEQKECLVSIGKNNFNIITGAAGTGKSTLLRGVIKIYNGQRLRIATCALSAKAAKRIEETTGVPSQTIHRLLGAKGLNEFSYNEKARLPYDVIVVDECSMVNASLLNKLIIAVKDGAKVILCGDARQLPSMGYGNIFYDVLRNGSLQINYLTKIMRQAAESGIITDANKIRDNVEVFPENLKPSNATNGNLKDMHYKFRDNRKRLNGIAIKRYISSVEKIGIDNVFIIVPRKNNCINSTSEINRQIQDILLEDESRYIEYGKKIFKVGSKVIHIKNNYEKNIFNGEIGYVKDIVYKGDSASEITVEYPDKAIEYMKSELNELDHAYALTVHKFQGSEAHTIIIIIDATHYTLLSTELLYTAITRAKDRCLLLAEPYAYNKSIKNNKGTNRQTWMKDFIESKEKDEKEK